MASKICSICGRSKRLKLFASYRRGGVLRQRSYCLRCHREREQQRYERQHDAICRRRRERRQAGDPIQRALRAARGGDLTPAFARAHLARPCIYCGRSDLPRLFDKIDSSRGYLQKNVAPCCERCLRLRQDMPIAAWLELVKAVRAADVKGLFGNWTPPG